MSTVRFTAEVLPDGTIRPPAGIHLAPGKAEITVDTADTVESSEAPGSLRNFAGAIHSGDARSADNERIDADLAREYGDSPPEAD
jgi:hypothetical protein